MLAQQGRFTARDLRNWVWEQEGYEEETQSLFLNFMVSCEICFELTSREYRHRSEENEFLAPAALPEYGPEVTRIARDYRDDAAATIEIAISSDKLSRESVFQLLVRLGGAWRRSAVLWRYGGQFQSYQTDRIDGPLTFVHLNWKSFTKDSYGGTLFLTQYGPNQDFLAAILDECSELTSFKGIEVPRIPRKRISDEATELHKKHPALEERAGEHEIHKPLLPIAHYIGIGFSFAGDLDERQDAKADCKDLPIDSIEQWPLALAKRLRQKGFQVEDYRREQSREFFEKEPSRRGYMEMVASQDFCVVFTSKAYFESPYCMYEFLKIYQRIRKEANETCIHRIGALPGGRFSQALAGNSRHKEFYDYWKGQLQIFNDKVTGEAGKEGEIDHQAIQRAMNQYAYKEWMDLVSSDEQFRQLIKAIRGGIILESVDLCPQDTQLNEWAESIERYTGYVENLFKYARQAWMDGERDKAKTVFRFAIDKQNSEKNREQLLAALETKLNDPALDDIRLHVWEDLRREPPKI